jgi:hypothetical protein
MANYQKDNVCQVDYKIVLINDIWQSGSLPKYILDKFYLLTEQYLNPKEFLSARADDSPTIVFNKGANYNLLVKQLDEHIDWIVFQEPFLLPNKDVVPYYFLEPKEGEIIKICHFYEPFLDSNRLGVFSIPREDYISRYGGFASYMFSFDKVEKSFIERVTRKGGIVKNITKTDSMNFTTKFPKYHLMEAANVPDLNIVVDKKSYFGYNDTIINEFEQKKLNKHEFYSFGINFTTLPLSTIKAVVTNSLAELSSNLADYIAFIYQVSAKANSDNSITIDMSTLAKVNDLDLVLFMRLTEQVRILNIELSNNRLDYEINMSEKDNGDIIIYIDNISESDD